MIYTNRGDLFIAAGESIKMQEQWDVIEPLCKSDGMLNTISGRIFRDCTIDYEFPMAVVEGKPVFVNDNLYHSENGFLTVCSREGNSLQWYDEQNKLLGDPMEYWSWVAPKPKTIMVELTVEDLQMMVNLGIHPVGWKQPTV